MSRTLTKKNNKNVVAVESPSASTERPIKELRPTVAVPTADQESINQGLPPLDFQPGQLVQGFIYGEILGKPRCRRGR